MNYKITFKFLISIVSLYYASCTIDGSFSPYQSPDQRNNRTHRGEDPCHPLYWYPRNIPEYCAYTTTIRPKPIIRPIIPMPIPVPLPLPPQPFYPPMYPPMYPPPMYPPPMYPPHMMPVMPPAAPPPGAPPQAVPFPVMAPPIPLPFGIPLAPTNPMIPVAGVQYNPFQPPPPPPPPMPMPAMPSIPHMPPANQINIPPQSQLGMVPGLPGIVSYDGGINIMPFSDAYADLLERHKQKMIRRRLQKFLDEYDRYPWKDRNKK